MSNKTKPDSITTQMRSMKEGDTLFFPLTSYSYILNIPTRALRAERAKGVRFDIKPIDEEGKVKVTRIA